MILHIEKIIQWCTYLFLFSLPWQTILIVQERFVNGIKWEYGTIGFYATEVLGWIIVLLFMVWYVKKRNWKLEIRNFTWSKDRVFILSLLLFVAYGVLSSFFAGDRTLAFQHAQWVMLGSLLFLLFYIGPVKPKSALWAFVLGSLPVSMLGIWQFLSQSTFASTLFGLSQHIVFEPGTSIIQSADIGRWLRAYGSFSHPNVFGGYLVFAIGSVLLLSFSAEKWKRVALQAIVVLQSAALFFTFSRSAFVALAIVLLFYCFIVVHNAKGCGETTQPHPNPPLKNGRGRARLFTFVATIAVVFAVFSFIYFPLLQTRFAASSSHEVASITDRVAGYSDAWHLFQNNWVIGVGGGNYTYALMQMNPNMPVWWYQPVHVVPLLFVVEEGAIGLAFFIFICIRFFKYQISNIKYQDLAEPMLFAICYLLFVAPLLLLDHYLWSSFTGIILLVVSSGLYIRSTRDEIFPHIVPI